MKNEKAYLKKFIYNEIDEDDVYIREKVKQQKSKIKPKKKDTKLQKGNKKLSEDWD